MEEEEITFKIRGCVFEVFRVLGAGFLEQVYQQALLHELALQGLRAEGQRALEVTYKEKLVGVYQADILVEDRIVLELKAAIIDKGARGAASQLPESQRQTGRSSSELRASQGGNPSLCIMTTFPFSLSVCFRVFPWLNWA